MFVCFFSYFTIKNVYSLVVSFFFSYFAVVFGGT